MVGVPHPGVVVFVFTDLDRPIVQTKTLFARGSLPAGGAYARRTGQIA
jgi:hypothetical protein